MKRAMSVAAALALLTGLAAGRAEDKKAFDDNTFVAMAASGGMHEVELGKIAAGRAKNEDVKKFAQKMVDDHSKANDELRAAAKEAAIPVPDKMLEKHQKDVDTFKNYKGDNFDRDYVSHMVKDHEQDVKLFTRASKEAKNPQVKAFAQKTLPVLQGHLEQVKKIQEQVK